MCHGRDKLHMTFLYFNKKEYCVEINWKNFKFKIEPDAWMPIEELITCFHPDNTQTRDSYEEAAIDESLMDYGFVGEPIVFNPWNRKIVSGHGRTQRMWNLGYREKLPVVFLLLESEHDHRFAMMRFNQARGHQNPEMQALEIQYFLDNLDINADKIQVSLAADDNMWQSLIQNENEEDSEENDIGDLVGKANLKTIKASVRPLDFDRFWSYMDFFDGNEADQFSQLLDTIDMRHYR